MLHSLKHIEFILLQSPLERGKKGKFIEASFSEKNFFALIWCHSLHAFRNSHGKLKIKKKS